MYRIAIPSQGVEIDIPRIGIHCEEVNDSGSIAMRWKMNSPSYIEGLVSYHSGGSMKLNAHILLLAHMVYL
jgi:hypothetical protein